MWALGRLAARLPSGLAERLQQMAFRRLPSFRPAEVAALLAGLAGLAAGRQGPGQCQVERGFVEEVVADVAGRMDAFGAGNRFYSLKHSRKRSRCTVWMPSAQAKWPVPACRVHRRSCLPSGIAPLLHQRIIVLLLRPTALH